MKNPNEPSDLLETTIQQGALAKVKKSYSLSGAKVDGMNILYFGTHGDTVKLCLCDEDARDVITLLEQLLEDQTKEEQNASSIKEAG